jgi:hypothetical protein
VVIVICLQFPAIFSISERKFHSAVEFMSLTMLDRPKYVTEPYFLVEVQKLKYISSSINQFKTE